jgi:hypothetical protein
MLLDEDFTESYVSHIFVIKKTYQTFMVHMSLTSPTSGRHSVGIVCSWTKSTEFVVFFIYTRVVRKIRVPMIFHNEKHVYWH